MGTQRASRLNAGHACARRGTGHDRDPASQIVLLKIHAVVSGQFEIMRAARGLPNRSDECDVQASREREADDSRQRRYVHCLFERLVVSNLLEQLAALVPSGEGRLIQEESTDSLRVTTSTERFRPQFRGDRNKSDNWLHVVQPAWS